MLSYIAQQKEITIALQRILRVRVNRIDIFFVLLSLFSFIAASAPAVEATWEYAVQVSASVQIAPDRITLSWPRNVVDAPTNYMVYRKTITDTNWGVGIVLSATATNYVDSLVTNGFAYEYQIVCSTALYKAYGYIYAGINAPLTEFRGKVLLLVDNTYATNLNFELARLQQDLVGDGWTVLRQDVSRNDTVPNIKALIQAQYAADTNNLKAVFLFGHIPVPYSGDIVPDTHDPEHHGAWPADLYYGDMDGVWTDDEVKDNGASYIRNRNDKGDGKFDQSTLPANVKLMIGRVDLSNMPGQMAGNNTFPSELDLLRNYLNKDHNFRHKLIDLPRRGLVGDYFGIRGGQAFAATGWRNFAPFFGAANVDWLPDKGTWVPTLATNGYLWAYACGGGDWTSISGIGNQGDYYNGTTTDFVSNDIKATFVLLFGSWFGDWDSQDDLMRSVLATPTYGLACGWGGSPHWFCHHMALGETIGYSARLTQNNDLHGLYQNQSNNAAGMIHVALMGDPTLRMHSVFPPSNLMRSAGSGVVLNWTGSTDSVVGYHVYRATNAFGPFVHLNNVLIGGSTFTDSNVVAGTYTYMVRAVKLESTPSGTYFNPSQGIFTTETISSNSLPTLTVAATDADANAKAGDPGTITFSRNNTNGDLAVHYALSGTAKVGNDYQISPASATGTVFIPEGAVSTSLIIQPIGSLPVATGTVTVSLMTNAAYSRGTPSNGTVTITGNSVAHPTIQAGPAGMTLTWPSLAGHTYRVAYKRNWEETYWVDFGNNIGAPGSVTSWSDFTSTGVAQRFYCIFETP
ncbi:MAG: hypothetical protein JWQ71_2346 [Pedosphaera sp.]|nr:hypothetical protein [Pedosphaera sp.]